MKQEYSSKKDIALQIGDEITAEITGYSHRGEGVIHQENQVIFVPGALLGEIHQVKIIAQKRGIFYAVSQGYDKKQDQRIEPCCSYEQECGGCQLQHMAYPAQLVWKTEQVKQHLQRLGGQELTAILRPTIGMMNPWHYRNKGIFHVQQQDDKVIIGFQKENSHQVVDVICPHLFSKAVHRLILTCKTLLNEKKYEMLGTQVKKILVRESAAQQELMVILILQKNAPLLAPLLRQLYQEIQQQGIGLKVFGYGLEDRSGNLSAKLLQYCSQAKTITECLQGKMFQISAVSFFQVNQKQTETMLRVIGSILQQKNYDTLIDAYCGIGTLGLSLAEYVNQVIGIEVVPQAVEDAKKNAVINGITQAKFYCGKAEVLFEKIKNGLDGNSIVLVDPPRKGCHFDFLQSLLALSPQEIIYVSCNPATLARDLKILCQTDYQLALVQPLDLFCQSYHVETICHLSKK